MRSITILLTCSALLVAGLIGVSLSLPLQAPAVVLLGLASVFAAFEVLRSGKFGGGGLVNPKLMALVFISMAYFVGRALTSPVMDLGVEDLMLILPASLLYLIAGCSIVGKKGVLLRLGLAWVVVILLILHLVSCCLQLGGGDGYSLSMLLTSGSRASEGFITGMYGYRGSFANFAVIAGILCLSLGVWGRFALLVRGLFFSLGGIALVFATLSQSRSAVISMVVALVLFGVLIHLAVASQRESVKNKVRLIVVMMVGLSLILSVFGGVKVFQNRADKEGGANVVFDSSARLAYWPMAIEQWQDHPVVGAGSRSFSYECFRYWSPNLPTSEKNPEFVHNEYFQLLADYGLIGFLLILILLLWHLYEGSKRVRYLVGKVEGDGLRYGSNAMALSIAGECGMAAMSVHIVFDFRTHLLANLLLLVCCTVWVLPVQRVQKDEGNQYYGCRVLGSFLLALGLGAILLGGQQLWGGWPLIENRMAKEDGAWTPHKVDRDVYIPMLEQSVTRSPNWRRYQRLGTLYRLEAASLVGDEQAVEKSKAAYSSSIERHAHNPIPWINLAAVYAEAKQFEKADQCYANASEMAKARERWFRMHSHWARMHQDWAVDLWRTQKSKQAEEHFLRAKELYNLSYDYAYFYQNKQYVVDYTQLLITYARFLDAEERYSDAELLFQEGKEQVNWYNWQTDTGLYLYYGQHLYEQGRKLWFQRQPEQAYKLMKQAKKCLFQYRGVMKGSVDKRWSEQIQQIQQVLDYLEQAGIQEK